MCDFVIVSHFVRKHRPLSVLIFSNVAAVEKSLDTPALQIYKTSFVDDISDLKGVNALQINEL